MQKDRRLLKFFIEESVFNTEVLFLISFSILDVLHIYLSFNVKCYFYMSETWEGSKRHSGA